MNTPTPRTDAAGDSPFKVYQISQKLERELTIALAEIDRLDVAGIHTCHSECQKSNCVLRRELTAVTEQLDSYKERYTKLAGKYAVEIHELTEQRDRALEDRNKYMNLYYDEIHSIVRPSWFKGEAACDWNEDAGHENGSYYCKCLDCDADFVGHKRRHICRKCHYEAKARYDALTPDERAAFDEKRNAEIRAFFETNA
jgi:hypothetical protein